MVWDRKRLEDVAATRLGDAKLIVVANREPFIHVYEGDAIKCMRPASGLTTALDPVMRVCGGTWVAHGSGSADHEVVDDRDRLAVPPDDPSYTLRRVWLTPEEEQGYYYGFANQALWPLCHAAYTRPRFNPEHWEHYRRVNQRFADAVLDEIDGGPAIVFVQDYHFALLPRMLKYACSRIVVMQFWHIPWPNAELFRVCPWQQEILDGLLGNDLLSFHIQHHCNNFLDTVDRTLEAKVDLERFAVVRKDHATYVRPHPISIAPDLVRALAPADLKQSEQQLRQRLGVGDLPLLVGVDRVDYIKGIPERFRAVDHLLTMHPELKGRFHLVQIGAPSRSQIPAYRRLRQKLELLEAAINARHGSGSWRPIIHVDEHFSPEQVYSIYRAASACVVSSLHDGMNLVAKEFVATRTDQRGVLILSRFTGAARELHDALLINPFDICDLAGAMREALLMPPGEQERRMRRMRQQVEDNNIYRWAGMLLSEAGKFVEAGNDQHPCGNPVTPLLGLSHRVHPRSVV